MTSALAGDVDLLVIVEAPHDRVLAALEDPQRGGPSAVTWCSAHLVAADLVLYAAAKRHAPQARPRVRAARAADHALQQALCRLDRRLTGDVRLAARSVDALVDEVRERLRAHADAEGHLVTALIRALPADEQQVLADRFAEANAAAPTRPHPHTPHTPLAGLVARLDAAVDRVRDVMDNRGALGERRTRPARVPGRWGCYLMGAPFPPAAAARPTDDAPERTGKEQA